MAFLFFLLLGAFAGVSSGLLGIGGGIIVVPGLALLFRYFHFPQAIIMHMAAGTSLAVMIATTTSSTIAHQYHHAIVWKLVRRMLPGICIGVVLGALTAHLLSSVILSVLFGLFAFIVGIRMLMLVKPKLGRTSPGFLGLSSFGVLVGAKSGLLGVGGGVLTVPFLVRCNVPIQQATATSVACGLFISMIGTLSFTITGWYYANGNIPWSSGYVYWPAFLGVGLTSILFAPLGAWLTHRLPTNFLKRLFGVFLLAVAMNMWFSTL